MSTYRSRRCWLSVSSPSILSYAARDLSSAARRGGGPQRGVRSALHNTQIFNSRIYKNHCCKHVQILTIKRTFNSNVIC